MENWRKLSILCIYYHHLPKKKIIFSEKNLSTTACPSFLKFIASLVWKNDRRTEQQDEHSKKEIEICDKILR